MKEVIIGLIDNTQKLYEQALERAVVNEQELEYIEQLINRLSDAKTFALWLEDFK